MLLELWKPIRGTKRAYWVSNLGRVRSADHYVRFEKICFRSGRTLKMGRVVKGKILTPWKEPTGYHQVNLGRGNSWRIHVLVARAFLGPNTRRLNVLHNDGNPQNNRVENLRYGTQKENSLDAVSHGSIKTGSLHHSWKHGRYAKKSSGV